MRLFKNEDANGYGHCIITLNQYRCDDLCKFKEDHMSDVETLRALHHYQNGGAAGYAVQPYIIPACGGCYSYCLGCLDVYRRIVIIPPYPGAYYYTCFETEAYNHEDDPDYLKRRIPFWGWISCIPNRKVKHKKTNL